MESVTDKFLRYISYETTSNEDSQTTPSSENQLDLSNLLVDECKKLGLKNITQKEGYVMAFLEKTAENYPKIGFIAHMDTSPDVSGKDIKPNIVKNYDGSVIKLSNGKELSPQDFPDLKLYVGEDIITTDGTTLLGADDKAGIAEIMSAVEYLKENSHIPHGEIAIAFTPDEEIGRGADKFDIKSFGADFAYTMDGGKIGELEFENFNAARVKIIINGRNVHPGYAKDTMINASLIGSHLVTLFPKNETPSATEKYEGFYHLCSFNGTVEECTITYILRDFKSEGLERRKQFVLETVENLNIKYNNAIELEICDEYRNMYEKIKDKKFIIDLAEKAMLKCGVTPIKQPIRGGTDGARLSYMGLACPNIFAGGHNFHGVYEFIPINSMEKARDVIINICTMAKGIK